MSQIVAEFSVDLPIDEMARIVKLAKQLNKTVNETMTYCLLTKVNELLKTDDAA